MKRTLGILLVTTGAALLAGLPGPAEDVRPPASTAGRADDSHDPAGPGARGTADRPSAGLPVELDHALGGPPHRRSHAPLAGPAPGRHGRRSRAAMDCKPRAPLDAVLWTTEVAAGRLDVGFAVESWSDFDAVRWHLELPDGVTLRSGHAAGVASGERGASTQGGFGLELPAGVRAADVTLVVTGSFAASEDGGSESLEVRRSLGPPSAEAVPRRHVVRGVAGSSGELAVLPATRRGEVDR